MEGWRAPTGTSGAMGARGDGPDAAVVAVAASGLAGSRAPVPDEPVDAAAWNELVTACLERDLLGLLSAADRRGTVVPRPEVADAVRRELGLVQADALRRTQDVDAAAVRASVALGAAGIDHRVTGGPVLARRAYRDPSVRHFSTATVLVRRDAVATARRVVEKTSPGAAEAVLVSAVVPTGSGAVHLDLAVAGPAQQVAGGAGDAGPLEALADEAQLLVSCVQATTADERSRLLALRDVAQLALHAPLDPQQLRSMAAARRLSGVVALALRAAWAQFDLADKTSLSTWALHHEASAPERRALDVHLGAFPARRRVAVAASRVAAALIAPVRRSPR